MSLAPILALGGALLLLSRKRSSAPAPIGGDPNARAPQGPDAPPAEEGTTPAHFTVPGGAVSPPPVTPDPSRFHVPGTVFEVPEVVITANMPLYYVVQAGDSLWNLARHWTGDPNRWRELRDAQPSKRRRARLSASELQIGWRLKLPNGWAAPNDVPDSQLEEYDAAVAADPAVAEPSGA